MATLATIDDFLAGKRIALVGASRDPKAFSNAVARELRGHGYDVIGVNRSADQEADEQSCRSVADLPPDIDRAIVMVAAAQSAQAVQECIDRGITRIWLHKGIGPSAVSPEALALCREHGVAVVDGECPLMFASPLGWPHRVHRIERKLTGRLPA